MQRSSPFHSTACSGLGTYRTDFAWAAWFLSQPFALPFKAWQNQLIWLEESYVFSGNTVPKGKMVAGDIFMFTVLEEGIE